MPLTGEFAKAADDHPSGEHYFYETDPFVILTDAFNARPADIEKQETFDDLANHLLLLLIKAHLMPVGAEQHWELIDTGTQEGIIAGDTSMPGILVTLYLPESREFADILIRPKDDATMADVYAAICELNISPAPAAD